MTITKTQVSSIFKWIGVTALPFFVYFLSPIDGKQFTHAMAMFLALTAWAVAMWCVNLINAAAVGLLLPCLYVVLCGVPEKVALSPWLSDVPFIVIGGFALGRILLDSGLGKRIGLWCVRAMGGSMAGTIIGIWLAVSIVAPFIPAIMGKAALFCAIGVSLCDALGFKPKSREATAIILAFCLAVASTKLCYLTGGGDVVLGVGLLKKFSGLDISWIDFAKDNFLPGMIYSAISIGLVMLLLPGPSNHKELKEVVKKDYAALGPVTGEQKRAALLLALTLILLVTDSLHKISAGVTLIAVTFIAFLPGMKLLDSEKFSRINFAPLFFIMGCMSIGSVGGALKVTDWIAGLALPYFSHLSESAAAITSYD